MDVPKVAPRQAVDQVAAVLDSPEVQRLIKTLEYVRWTGRPGYPIRAMVGMCFVKAIYNLSTWSRAVRLVAEHSTLQAVLGAAPSQWACYRFARQLRDRDEWAFTQCVNDVLASLKRENPDMGKNVAIDASDMPAYSNGRKTHWNQHKPLNPSDKDASWGYRSAVSTRAAGNFFGYKIDAAVDTATGLPLAWNVRTAKHHEHEFAIGLIERVQARGFDVATAIMDKGYDTEAIHFWTMHRGVAPIIPLRETKAVKKGKHEPPHCAHGEWTYAGTDYKRRATKWRCPTGECKPGSMWRHATRLHPLIPRETERFGKLYRSRSAVEREFGRLKHEWALLPLRVRGVERVKLHADLTILAQLARRLSTDRAVPLVA